MKPVPNKSLNALAAVERTRDRLICQFVAFRNQLEIFETRDLRSRLPREVKISRPPMAGEEDLLFLNAGFPGIEIRFQLNFMKVDEGPAPTAVSVIVVTLEYARTNHRDAPFLGSFVVIAKRHNGLRDRQRARSSSD